MTVAQGIPIRKLWGCELCRQCECVESYRFSQDDKLLSVRCADSLVNPSLSERPVDSAPIKSCLPQEYSSISEYSANAMRCVPKALVFGQKNRELPIKLKLMEVSLSFSSSEAVRRDMEAILYRL